MTPTQRTLKSIRDRGSMADVVERWIPIPNHPAKGLRRDLFNFIDIVELQEDCIVGIQCTASGSSARITKIKTECREAAIAWLKGGGRIQVWGWRKLKKKVDRKTWHPKITEIRIEDLVSGD